jgi:2-deoxy-D-gluconate 3-dehydrogenase
MMTGPFDLTGRVAVVTGANSGISLGMALGLVAAGAKIAEAAGEAMAIEADVVQEDDCRRLIGEGGARFGRLDILVNNAGTNQRKPPETFTLAEWNGLLTLNLTGAFLCSQAAYPEMCGAGGGKTINIGSMPRFSAPPSRHPTPPPREEWCS